MTDTRHTNEISDDWGEPIVDVSDTVIPAVFVFALAAVGATTVGRWLLRRAADNS